MSQAWFKHLTEPCMAPLDGLRWATRCSASCLGHVTVSLGSLGSANSGTDTARRCIAIANVFEPAPTPWASSNRTKKSHSVQWPAARRYLAVCVHNVLSCHTGLLPVSGAMIAQSRTVQRATHGRIARAPRLVQIRCVVVKARNAGNDDPGTALRSTAKRFGGPSQAGNDAIAEAVRFPM